MLYLWVRMLNIGDSVCKSKTVHWIQRHAMLTSLSTLIFTPESYAHANPHAHTYTNFKVAEVKPGML